MDFDIVTCNSLEIILYQHGSLADANKADIITETISYEGNPETSDVEVRYVGPVLRLKLMS